MKEKAGDKMALTVFQQKFKNALLNITDNIDDIYAEYLFARVDEVRQEIIDGINNGTIQTIDDVDEITMQMTPMYRKETWRRFYSGDKSVKLAKTERYFADAILSVEKDVDFAYKQYYLAGNDEICRRIVFNIENGTLTTRDEIEVFVREISPIIQR